MPPARRGSSASSAQATEARPRAARLLSQGLELGHAHAVSDDRILGREAGGRLLGHGLVLGEGGVARVELRGDVVDGRVQLRNLVRQVLLGHLLRG